jgi:hypothetical protein
MLCLILTVFKDNLETAIKDIHTDNIFSIFSPSFHFKMGSVIILSVYSYPISRRK